MDTVYRAIPPHVFEPLDLHSVKEFPETHAWPFKENDTPVEIEPEISVIDLADEKAMQLLGDACKKWGIFHIVNHNVRQELLDEVTKTVEGLFSLPMEQKLKAEREPDGVTGYGKARNSVYTPKLCWYEGFCIIGSPLEHFRKLWPTDYKKFCDMMDEYEKEMRNLAERLLSLILGAIGVTKDELNWVDPEGKYDGGSSIIQFNSYPTCPDPDRAMGLAMGLAPHTDSGILTILNQSNNVTGLQIFRESVGWVPIKPITGALTVNVADLLHIISNGLYHSIYHRAMVNLTQYRASIAYFYGPPPGVKVAPSPKVVDESHPLLYKPVTWKEIVQIKAQHFEKGLSTISALTPVDESVDAKDDHNAQDLEKRVDESAKPVDESVSASKPVDESIDAKDCVCKPVDESVSATKPVDESVTATKPIDESIDANDAKDSDHNEIASQ